MNDILRRGALFGSLALLTVVGCAAKRQRKTSYAPPSTKAKSVVRTARSYLPEENYKGQNPTDCSDFVDKVFTANGVSLPRTAVAMSIVGERVASSKELRMGDLVFFSGTKVSRIVGHVGIYVGNGIFIHLSQPEVGVRMESMYSDYYRKRYLSARRVLN